MSIESRGVCRAIKEDRTRWDPPERVILRAARRLNEEFGQTDLREILPIGVVLVPAPKSGLLMAGSLWPARRICEELVAHGIGQSVLPCLKRVEAVRKSASAAPADRPKAEEHYRTMLAERPLAPVSVQIAVVDDVVTRGATLLAAISRVKDAFPEADVTGFGLVRTQSGAEVAEIVSPCVGTLELTGGECFRRP